MIPQAEGNQCVPSIYKPSSAYYADITTVTHWKHSRSYTCARLLSDASILKIRTGCKCFFSSLRGPPVLFSLLLCQAGFGKGSPHRPTDRLTVSNRSWSRCFPDATRRRWTKSGVRVQVFRVRRWRRCHRPHRKRLPRADSLRVTR